eukprot:scaffold45741_cov69-Phaeocystis_antarctica.AAC.1
MQSRELTRRHSSKPPPTRWRDAGGGAARKPCATEGAEGAAAECPAPWAGAADDEVRGPSAEQPA